MYEVGYICVHHRVEKNTTGCFDDRYNGFISDLIKIRWVGWEQVTCNVEVNSKSLASDHCLGYKGYDAKRFLL